MKEKIIPRTNFNNTNIEQTAYLVYEPYKEIPNPEEYEYGKEKEIVLKNIETGMLEKIKYTLCGAIPFIYRTGYQEYWGKIRTTDNITCYLDFSFALDGKLKKITASFAGESPSVSEFAKMNKQVTYAGQITAVGEFGTLPLESEGE